jgi:hypothetical protein
MGGHGINASQVLAAGLMAEATARVTTRNQAGTSVSNVSGAVSRLTGRGASSAEAVSSSLNSNASEGAAGAADDTVSLYRAPQRGQAPGPFDHKDFPGRGGLNTGEPDGRAYFSPDRSVVEPYAKSYGRGTTRVDVPRASYERMLRTLEGVDDAGLYPYQGGPSMELAIPRWLIPWINKFPMVREP